METDIVLSARYRLGGNNDQVVSKYVLQLTMIIKDMKRERDYCCKNVYKNLFTYMYIMLVVTQTAIIYRYQSHLAEINEKERELGEKG